MPDPDLLASSPPAEDRASRSAPRAPRSPLNLEPYEWRAPAGFNGVGARLSADGNRDGGRDAARLTNWSEIFGDARPVELEVGSGKGLFLANAAASRLDRNFLGIEITRKFARKAMERLAKRRLNNVKMFVGDARPFLKTLAPEGRLEAVHIYFPDPWWKKRHKKRRVFCEDFVDDSARVLKLGGEFRMATDVEEYFGAMMAIMRERTDFEPIPSPLVKPAEHEADYLTNFERKYRREGRTIYRAAFRLAERSIHGPSPTSSRDENSAAAVP